MILALSCSSIVLYLFTNLFIICSVSVYLNIVPLDWRTHLIKPIFKSGDKTDVKNYRPISLLCIVSKVLLYNHLIDFVNRAISKYQFGFLQCRSTLQQLLIFTNTIANNNSQSDVVYLDLRRPLTELLIMKYCTNCGHLALLMVYGCGFVPI